MSIDHSCPVPGAVTASRRGTVVIVDDSSTVRAALTRWLETERFEVIALSQSLGATQVIMRVLPDVALLDIDLPGLSGDRLAIVMNQNPATAAVPVIFYSQIAPSELRRLAHECSVVGAISKTGDRFTFLREFEKLAAPFLDRGPRSSGVAGLLSEPPRVGVPEIDEQHARIAKLLSELDACTQVRSGGSSRPLAVHKVKKVALELLVFMRFHLTVEERIMRDEDRPAFQKHRAEHSAYLEAAQQIERQLGDSSVTVVVAATRSLRQIALEHMWVADAELAAQARGVGPASKPASRR